MKTVKMPDYQKPDYRVVIDGVTYSYTPGATVEVPDRVAEIVENFYNSLPKEAEPKQAGDTQINENSDDRHLPTSAAVKRYVDGHAPGGGIVVLNGIIADGSTTDADVYYGSDKLTFDDVKEFFEKGDNVVIDVKTGPTEYYIRMNVWSYGDEYVFSVVTPHPETGEMSLCTATIENDETAEHLAKVVFTPLVSTGELEAGDE